MLCVLCGVILCCVAVYCDMPCCIVLSALRMCAYMCMDMCRACVYVRVCVYACVCMYLCVCICGCVSTRVRTRACV